MIVFSKSIKMKNNISWILLTCLSSCRILSIFPRQESTLQSFDYNLDSCMLDWNPNDKCFQQKLKVSPTTFEEGLGMIQERSFKTWVLGELSSSNT